MAGLGGDLRKFVAVENFRPLPNMVMKDRPFEQSYHLRYYERRLVACGSKSLLGYLHHLEVSDLWFPPALMEIGTLPH